MKGTVHFFRGKYIITAVVSLSWALLLSPAGVVYAEGEVNDPEQLRDSLREILQVEGDIADKLIDTASQAAISDALSQLESMTAEELEVFQGLGQDLDDLKYSFDLLNDIVDEFSNEAVEQRMRISAGSLGSANYSGFCGSTRINTDDYWIAKTVLIVAKLVRDTASRGCNQVGVIAGFGANTSLACIVTDTIFNTADGVFAMIDFCVADVDSAEIEGAYERAEDNFNILVEHDGEVKSALAQHDVDLKQLLSTHDDDIKQQLDQLEATMSGRLDAIDASLAEIKDLLITPHGQRDGFPN
jgi:hypothetical protein